MLDPTTTLVAAAPRLIGVPDTVMAGPPGTSVCDPIAMAPDGAAGLEATATVFRVWAGPEGWFVPTGGTEPAVQSANRLCGVIEDVRRVN